MPGSGVAHLYSQNWEVDRGRRISEFDWGQAGLQSEFQGSQGYTEKYCLKIKKKKKASKQASKQANKQTADRPLFIYIENTFCQLTCQGPEFKSQQPHGQGKKKKT